MIPFVRPAKASDLPFLFNFSKEVGYGFTSMPPHEEILKEKIAFSTEAFKERSATPSYEIYLFVLEVEGKPVGSSGVVARMGLEEPFWSFQIQSEKQTSPSLHIERSLSTLHLEHVRRHPTEICSLFLEKSYRKRHLGLLLSFSRFLFMAAFPDRFAPLVIAELRGFIDERGNSPFWSAIGSHFFGMSLQEATEWRFHHPECIDELFPKHPLYTMLLPREAQQAIRSVHPQTVPALKLLQKQGFDLNTYVDLFDAGPHVQCPLTDIWAVKSSKTALVTEVKEKALASTEALITNERPDFRATVALFEGTPSEGIALHKETADALCVEVGQKVRIYPL